ncbi:MAG: PGF-CTERM sorting domain-containing protein [Halobacteria archaeon]|nr:PGF-CTERM sorting domain-containing protein [Halobacteria archaeon]
MDMDYEKTMAGVAVAVVVVSLVLAIAVPDVIGVEGDTRIREGRVGIQEVDIKPLTVSGGSVELKTITRLSHRGGVSDNVTVEVRATSLESGMLETTSEKDVGTLEGDKERAVSQNITVERSGGYRIDAVVYKDGERVAQEAKRVSGVGNLQPAFARTPVRFHDFSTQPPIEYSVESVSGNRVGLDTTVYLTNNGDEASQDMRIVLKARQSDSNIVADSQEIPVGSIQAGQTATPTATLEVPDNYNYYLDAVLWKDGSIVGTSRSVANLNPTKRIRANVTEKEVGLKVSDFKDEERERLEDMQPNLWRGQ